MSYLGTFTSVAGGSSSQVSQKEEVSPFSGGADTSTTTTVAACALTALTSAAEGLLGGLMPSIKTLSSFPVSSFYTIRAMPKDIFPPEKIELTTLPHSIISHLDNKPHAAFKDAVSWSDPELSTVAVPTDEGLVLLAAKYSKKYDIPIFIAGSSEKLRSAVLGESTSEDTLFWGVIATSGSAEALHVTPLICMRMPSGQIQIAEMDSVRQPILHVKHLFIDLAREKANVDIFSSYFARQADYYSCRSDAIVLLKDALRDLKAKKVTDLKTFLGVHLKNGIIQKFFLPDAWSKTVQISGSIAGTLAQKAISKRNISMKEFRELYNAPVTKVESFSLHSFNALGHVETTSIMITTKKIVNTFLNLKGKIFMREFADLQSSQDFDLQMRFGFLLDTYK